MNLNRTGTGTSRSDSVQTERNNSKTIRLDREDRRYFIPDISNKYVENGIGMDHYYAPLDKAIKNLEVGKAFYSYALEYIKLNPNFDERKIPMTKTKLMMINRDNNPVYQFIKEKYIYNSIRLDVASLYFYNTFKDWFYIQINTKNKKPPTIQEFIYTIRELGLNSKQKRVGEQKNNKRMQWYETSYENLYTIFLKRNMIDETENLNIPDGFNSIEKMKTLYIENFPLEEPLQDLNEVFESSNTSKQSELESKSKSEYESESESKLESESKKVGSLKTRSCESTPEPIIYKNNNFKEMYINAKTKWKRFGNDPEDFDWECFITEIEELSNHEQYDFQKDPWHHTLRMLVQLQKSLINGEIAIELRKYFKERGTVYIPSLTNHKTESIIQYTDSIINTKECGLAEDIETFSDSEDEDWYNGLEKMCDN
ncbi:hypothetical protein Glove_117g589 [Diversispora epigaea]|uniref:Uncharacterized protein n=1 Tax=Diversispora epigaea TaxID=1348612 RepID=A0A397J2R4_9GLOM|nr:hypothetical protein Glove_117g589 [Diversispora epigaea]